MAKQVHVLEQVNTTPGMRAVFCVFWFSISGSAQVPKPGYISRAPSANVAGADQAALESGALLEEVLSLDFPASYTTIEMKALINKRYTDRATAIAALPNARAFYGVFFDSVGGWSA